MQKIIQSSGSGDDGSRPVLDAVLKGTRGCCPACGKGKLFKAFLKIADQCPACGEDLSHQRADDAPAYFTIVVVGHIVVGLILTVEQNWAPDPWLQAAFWIPLTIALSLLLLPRFKGALVGLQWALKMHGFGGTPEEAVPDPAGPGRQP